jgi:preprotein translocase subunit SecE
VNRQTKRTLQGEAVEAFEVEARPPQPMADREVSRRAEPERASLGARIAQYFREVRAELAKVLWPKRSEVVNYSTVVLTTLVLIALLIFGLNYLFAQGVLHLYPK